MHPAAFVDKLAGIAVAAKSEVVVLAQLRGREAVMQFGERDILRADSGFLVGLLRRAPSERADIGQREIAFSPGIRREHRGCDPRALAPAGELLQLVLADEYRRRRAVSSRATHIQRVGKRNHPPIPHVSERDFLAMLRARIFARMLTALPGD